MKKKLFNKLSAVALSSVLALAPLTQVFATTHTVQSGEWLWGIARQYGITADDIKNANGLTSDWIDVGMVLIIPSPGSGDNGSTPPPSTSGVHIVQPGDTLSGIARAYGITVSDLMAWNGLTSSWINVGDRLVVYGTSTPAPTPTPPSNSSIYIVQPGDTLSGIASAYGITVSDLMAWNGLTSSWIHVGDRLTVVGTPVNPTPTPTPPSTGGNYVIQPGDTLSGIAYRFGITVYDLMIANNLSSDWLIAGNSLYIPGRTGHNVPYPPNWDLLPDANAVDGVHTVQPGDTLSGIALVYGITVSDLYAWNGLSSDWLNVGDRLNVVPTSGPIQSTPSTPKDEQTTDPTSSDNKREESTKEEESPKEKDKRDSTKPKGPEQTNKVINGMRVADLPTRARPDIHVVTADDTLESIAEDYDITVDHIRRWNRLTEDDAIEEGQELFVSNPGLIPKIHEVKESETLYDIAMEYGTTEQWLMIWNELEDNAAPEEGTLMIVSNPDPVIHEVVTGETLQDIADQYEITLEELREWNSIPERVTIVNGVLIVSNPSEGNEEELEVLGSTQPEEQSEEITDEVVE